MAQAEIAFYADSALAPKSSLGGIKGVPFLVRRGIQGPQAPEKRGKKGLLWVLVSVTNQCAADVVLNQGALKAMDSQSSKRPVHNRLLG